MIKKTKYLEILLVSELKFNNLIEEQYNSASKRNINYSKKYTRKEMKEFWYNKLKNIGEKECEELLRNIVYCANNNISYHPV